MKTRIMLVIAISLSFIPNVVAGDKLPMGRHVGENLLSQQDPASINCTGEGKKTPSSFNGSSESKGKGSAGSAAGL